MAFDIYLYDFDRCSVFIDAGNCPCSHIHMFSSLFIMMSIIYAEINKQILLILGINKDIGIPDFYFALGDSSITTFVQAILFMPACIMVNDLDLPLCFIISY